MKCHVTVKNVIFINRERAEHAMKEYYDSFFYEKNIYIKKRLVRY